MTLTGKDSLLSYQLKNQTLHLRNSKLYATCLESGRVGFFFFFLINFLFYFTILYWFSHTLTWIQLEYTCVPHKEPPSHLPPHRIPLGHHSAPSLSTLSVSQFSNSVVSDSLQPHELQHARLPCPSPTPGVHSNSRPSSQWCHPAIALSVIPLSSCPQSLPASESFPMSQLFTWGDQSAGVTALASFLPKKSQGWSLLQ